MRPEMHSRNGRARILEPGFPSRTATGAPAGVGRTFALLLSTGLLLASPVAALAQTPASAQEKAAAPHQEEPDYRGHFRVFTGAGEPATLDDIVELLDETDALLLGETHTDPVGHWIQDRLLGRALERYGGGAESGALRRVALSMEFFERDVQPVVNEYLEGLITESQFVDDARAVRYYEEDYRPLVERAREARIPVIAANAPRRYVNRVSRLGRQALEALSPWAMSFLPPMPFPRPSDTYRQEWETLMREMPMVPQCEPPPGEATDETDPTADELPDMPPHQVEAPPVHPDTTEADTTPHGMPPHGMPSHMMGDFMENGLQAQTLWDASMAHSITSFLDMNPGSLVVHVVGGFHVQNFTGIPEQIRHYRPETRMLVVAMEVTEDFETFHDEEFGGVGDFVILTDKALDKYYERNCVR